jgi:(p)ppGpp synthase/HD superfamily hydrolase
MMKAIREAFLFAYEAHAAIDQRRKYTNDPYIVHPLAVAGIVSSVLIKKEEIISEDVNSIQAALLHDVVEDTPVDIETIGMNFGMDVMILVEGLTDVSKKEDGNRKIRKQMDLEHTSSTSPRVKTIKLADLIHNSASILAFDKDFSVIYLKEKRRLLDNALREGDPFLWHWADRIVRKMGY